MLDDVKFLTESDKKIKFANSHHTIRYNDLFNNKSKTIKIFMYEKKEKQKLAKRYFENKHLYHNWRYGKI